jgi:hypothetical protein
VTHQSCKQDHVVRSQSICLSGMRAVWGSKDNLFMVPPLYEDPPAFPSFSSVNDFASSYEVCCQALGTENETSREYFT